MPVELRKRKAPAEPAPAPPPKKKSNPVKQVASKVKAAVSGSKPAQANGTGTSSKVGDTIPEGFGGDVQLNDGTTTNLAKLLADSKGGVVLFTYPKASTPGCTKQACLFRDEFTPLTSTGFSIYGLSRDSPKSNTTFQDRQKLPYPLLCDSSATLIGAIGMKNGPKTTRGVFVVNKAGKILAAESGGPDATVEVVRKLVADKDNAQTESANVDMPDAPAVPTESASDGAAKTAPTTVEAEPTKEEPKDHSTNGTLSESAPAASNTAPAAVKVPPAPTVETAAPTPVPPTANEPNASEPLVTREPPAPIPAESTAKATISETENKTVPAGSVPEQTPPNGVSASSDAAIAKVASEVADSATAAKLDPATPNPA